MSHKVYLIYKKELKYLDCIENCKPSLPINCVAIKNKRFTIKDLNKLNSLAKFREANLLVGFDDLNIPYIWQNTTI